jgi:tetratricopeptide (TPR) repeat protein
MTHVEWFRHTSWTPEDEADFAARLKRSRTPYHRAQYLRIQAGHLRDVGTRDLAAAALRLLDQLLAEYPEPTQLSTAYLQRAECLFDLERPEDALTAYRQALETQRQYPQWQNQAYLGFGELAVALHRRELYDEVLAALEEFGGYAVFPVDRFRAAVIRALVADEQGDRSIARDWARRALEAAAATESPFRYHRKLGLVRSAAPTVLEWLKGLTA